MKSKIIIGLLLLLMVSGVFAQQAVIKEITGTVEIKRAGSAVWEKAVQGRTITADTTISTGFKSSALLAVGNSVLTVRPLTRLTLTEIAAGAGTETINVNLQTGRAQINANPPAGGRGSFTVQTPVATASTRGTVFEVDSYTLRVTEGSIEYKNTSGILVIVDAGGYSYIDERTGRAALPEQTLFAALNPELPIASSVLNSFDAAAQSKDYFEVFCGIDYQ